MLNMTQLIGFGAGGGDPAYVDYIATYKSSSDSTAYTFASSDIGAVGGNRHVIVAIASTSSSAGRTVASVSVAGVTATEIKTHIVEPGANTSIASIWSANVPTGTSGDIVVTHSAGMARCGVSVYAARNLKNNSAVASASDDQKTALTLSLTGTAEGFCIGVVNNSGSKAYTWAWTGLTEDSDEDLGGDSNGRISAASLDTLAGGTLAITATISSGTSTVGCAAYMV